MRRDHRRDAPEKSTVIPGVAIATALMPPLCTAGYGIATGQPMFFFGAFYLFTINAVYIALSALLFTRLLRLPRHSFPSPASQKQAQWIITAAIMLTIVPSVYLAIPVRAARGFQNGCEPLPGNDGAYGKNLFIWQKRSTRSIRKLR